MRRVAAHGLETRTHAEGSLSEPSPPTPPLAPRALPARPLPDDGWTAVLTAARRERVTGPLLAAVTSGALAATAEQERQAARVHTRVVEASLRLEQALVDLVERFECAGVDHRVLKGPAIAHLDEPAPWLRGFGDIDVLVRTGQLETARDLLLAAGGRRRFPEPRPGYDRRFGKGICVVAARGIEVDLHRTLCPGPFGLAIDLPELFAEAQPFVVGGRTLAALSPVRRFLHACYHAVLGSARPRLGSLRDVALTAPADPASAHEAHHLAAAWQAEIVVRHALTEASLALGWSPPTALTGWVSREGAGRQRRWLAAYVGAGRSSVLQGLYGAEALDTWTDRARYLHAALRPGPGGRRWRRLARRGVTTVRWRGLGGGAAAR